MNKAYQRGWKDLQVELEQKLEKKTTHNLSECPDCKNRLYFLEGGFLCPVCGFSTETIYAV